MIFEFPESRRAVFKRNFLRHVVFHVSYGSMSFNKKFVEDAFKSDLPRVGTSKAGRITVGLGNSRPIIQHEQDDSMIEMKSSNGQKILTVMKDSITINISGSDYSSFEIMQPFITKVVDFLVRFDVETVSSISLRKVNLIGFRSEAGLQVSSALFNENLSNALMAFPSTDGATDVLNTFNLVKDSHRLNTKYGVKITSESISQAILDIEVNKINGIAVSELSKTAESINEEIFSAFNWMISENLRTNILNGQ